MSEPVQYQIVRKLARGGMGEVYLARHQSFGGFSKDVVLKKIQPEYAEDPEFVSMFLEEARIAALLDHPNVVQLYELGQAGESYFLVMEHVPGLSVSRLMAGHDGPLPLQVAVQIAAGVAAGLQFAHDKRDLDGEPLNLVHRDVSPPNVLCSTSGDVKLTDFGIAKVRWSRSRTQVGVIKGKYSYISPEQAGGQPADRRSDIYALGLVLYEMTTGQRAYPHGNDAEVLHAVASGRFHAPEQIVPDYAPDLRRVLMRALAFEPAERYAEAQQLQDDLLALLDSRGLTASQLKVGQLVEEVLARLVARQAEQAEAAAAVTETRSASTPTRPTPPGPALGAVSSVVLLEERDLEEVDDFVVEGATLNLQRVEAVTSPRNVAVPSLPPAAGVVEQDAPTAPPPSPSTEEQRAAATEPPPSPSTEEQRAATTEPAPGVADLRRGRATSPLLLVLLVLALTAVVTAAALRISGWRPGTRRTSASLVAAAPDVGGRAALERTPITTPLSSARPDASPVAPDAATATGAARSEDLTQVEITSLPVSDVLVGRHRLGQTPLTTWLPRGKVTLAVRNARLGVGAARTITLRAARQRVHFAFARGRIGFRVEPRRVIFVDDRRVGVSPLPPVTVFEGTHQVLVANPSTGEKQELEVKVRPGTTSWVTVE